MRQQLLDLNEVQKIDLEIRNIEALRQDFSDKLQTLESGVEQTREKVQQPTEQRETLSRDANALEAVVQTETLKIRKWESRLVEIRNQREYLALSREIEGTRRANRDSEEKILEMMTQREAIEKELDELQDNLAEEEVDCATERAKVEREAAEAEQRIDAQIKRRDGLLHKIPANLLKRYDRVRGRRLGIGLVPVVDGCCQGCNMRLPPQLYNTLQRGDSIEQCPSCFRIVFWDQILGRDDQTEQEGAGASP